MMAWNVIECLYRFRCMGMEGDDIYTCAEEVLNDVERHFIMLVVRCHVVGRCNGKNWKILGCYMWLTS